MLAYPGNEPLAESLRKALDADPVAFAMRRFPDGESYVRIDSDAHARPVALLCSLDHPDTRVLPLVF